MFTKCNGRTERAAPPCDTSYAELLHAFKAPSTTSRFVEPAHFDSLGEAPIVTPRGTARREAYLRDFALPNFFFHLATVHAILRHNGVPLGKLDYLGIKKP